MWGNTPTGCDASGDTPGAGSDRNRSKPCPNHDHGGPPEDDRRVSRIYRDERVPVIYEGANPIQRDLIYGQAPR